MQTIKEYNEHSVRGTEAYTEQGGSIQVAIYHCPYCKELSSPRNPHTPLHFCPTCGAQTDPVSDELPFVDEKPIRIQRKRTKGWKKPANTVYVGRPSKWGNPCSIKDAYRIAAFDLGTIKDLPITENRGADLWVDYAGAIVIREFKSHLERNPELINLAKKELKGKNLMCFCKIGEPCHADILLEIANDKNETE